MPGLEVSCVAFPPAPPLLCVFAAFLCVKGLSTGNQVEVAPQLAVPDLISFCTSRAAPMKSQGEDQDCFKGEPAEGQDRKIRCTQERKKGLTGLQVLKIILRAT